MKKQYLITDPCYILPDETWDECCSVMDNTTESYKLCDDAITKELRKYSGTDDAQACGTGFGDWSNEINSSGEGVHHIIHSEFAADSGTVCVVEYNDKIKAEFPERLFKNGCAALVETEGNVTIYLHQDDPDWTEVEIIDFVSGSDRIYKSLPANEYEEED